MIKVIGKNGCSRCSIVKQMLKNKKIDFKYQIYDEITKEDKKKYISLARKSNILQFPIIIKDNKVVELKEVM